jgi:hypothetical protein
MTDATRAPSADSPDTISDLPPFACGTCDVITAEPHRLDALIEAALDDWSDSPIDQRTEGSVVRSVLTDPANRPIVLAWLAEVGLTGGAS